MINLNDILNVIDQEYDVLGTSDISPIKSVKSIEEADSNSLIWIKKSKKQVDKVLKNTTANIIICHKTVDLPNELQALKCLIRVENPRLAINSVLKAFFWKAKEFSIHPTAIIHPNADIATNVSIGAFTVIGNTVINNNSVVGNNVIINDNVEIGSRVKIQDGVVLGAEGFGYVERDDKYERIIHIGGLIIKDDVEIGANSTIDIGVLENTVIECGTKINNLVHVAHGVKIGQNVIIAAHVNISGSSIIGDGTWLGPGVIVRNSVIIGKNVTIGMGAVVTKNLSDGITAYGNPAKPK